MDYKELIRNIPDFPVKGILFRDLTTLWKNKEAFRRSLEELAERWKGEKIDKVVAVEARGFIVGSTLAYLLGAGFVPVRKKGKLPAETIREEYSLEYGKDVIEMHKDAIEAGEKVLIVDDLLATGGTALAMINLVKKAGGEVVGATFLVELTALKGREKLQGIRVETLIQY